MEVQQLSVEQLSSDPANARKHGDHNLATIVASLRRFGQQKPIVIDKSGVVRAGNGTLEAARQLGWETIAVVQTALESSEATAYAIADNRTAELAEWDNEVLMGTLEGLQLEDPDLLAAAGFTDDELAAIADEFREDDELDEDPTPAPPATPTTKPGDIYELGKHRLMCGDSTSEADVRALVGDTFVDAVVTDPPYNVAYEGKTADALTIENDEMGDGEFYNFLLDAFTNACQVTKPGGPMYVCHADTEGVNFRNAYNAAGFELKQLLTWVKNSMVLGRQDYNWKHEPILYGWKPGAAHCWYGKFDKTTVIDDDIDLKKLGKPELIELINKYRNGEFPTAIRESRPTVSVDHPTMKPVNLIAFMVRNSTREGDTVLDLFGGSGSTMSACEQLGRRARLLELDPKYCDVIVQRWEALTGERAVLIRDGRTIEAA